MRLKKFKEFVLNESDESNPPIVDDISDVNKEEIKEEIEDKKANKKIPVKLPNWTTY